MKTNRLKFNSDGFSLIEVLIAVVVLSFGVLALAALQARVIQASSDAKAQTVALALAKDRLEQMRGYQCVGGCTNSFASLASGTDTISAAGGGTGGVDFTRTWTVTRHVLPAAGGAFCVAGAPGCATGIAPNSEFKTVDVRVTWTDARNETRLVVLEDAIAGLDPADSARSQRSRGGVSRGPKVIIFDPSNETGVIPIAVGEGAETAATNPKPVNVGRTGEDAVETRFDVLTYAALSGGTALAQSRVETTVVGCTCTNAATSAKGYRPTYWDGYRYVPPQAAPANATARAASGVTQSRYCDACCRDHHDPVGVSGAKFSPRRSVHTHFKRDNSNQLVVAGANDNYLEACRLIRVDGIFDTAADLSNDYFNLLPTADNSSSPAPSEVGPDAVGNYQNFVLSYLNSRFVSPNPGVGQESATYNNRAAPSPDAAAGSTLNLADPIELNVSASAAEDERIKWLHARGLYIDYLEPQALNRIGDAKSNCGASPTTEQLRDCVLRVLPFTSINLTEIAGWTPLNGAPQIQVTNDDFSTSIDFTDPIRGKVQAGTSPNPNTQTNAFAKVGSSNSGVAIAGDINTDEDGDIAVDTNGSWMDSQLFRIINGAGGVAGGTFNFGTANYAISSSNPRSLGFTYGSTAIVCGVSGTLNPVVCGTRVGQPLPAEVTVRVGQYNTTSQVSRTNPCKTTQNDQMPYLADYAVSSITTNGAGIVGSLSVQNAGRVGPIAANGGEYTEAVVSMVGQGDTVTANMSAPVYKCPAQSSPGGYTCGGGGNNTVTWSNDVSTYTAAACSGTFP